MEPQEKVLNQLRDKIKNAREWERNYISQDDIEKSSFYTGQHLAFIEILQLMENVFKKKND